MGFGKDLNKTAMNRLKGKLEPLPVVVVQMAFEIGNNCR